MEGKILSYLDDLPLGATDEFPLGIEVNGSYFQDCRLADPYEDEIFPWATNKVEAEKLWKLTEKLVGQEFKY